MNEINKKKISIFKYPFFLIYKIFVFFKDNIIYILVFFSSLIIYIIGKLLVSFFSIRIFPNFLHIKIQRFVDYFYLKMANLFGIEGKNTISRLELIELAFENLKIKKTRTFITIGGMAIGIAAIVFLVSIGYGVQNLVITRIAKLNEMMQANISSQPGSKIEINDETLANIKNISEVEEIFPVISVVGKVNFNDSISDMAVYGVTSDYLKQIDVYPSQGSFFESNDLQISVSDEKQFSQKNNKAIVLGESIDKNFNFNIEKEEWLKLREEPSIHSKVLGYVKRGENFYQGETEKGGNYQLPKNLNFENEIISEENNLWIKTKLPVWEFSNVCEELDEKEENKECKKDYFPLKEDGNQVYREGYIAYIFIEKLQNTIKSEEPVILGESETNLLDENEEESEELLVISETDDSDWVELESESILDDSDQEEKVSLSGYAVKEAVVNRAMLSVLNINEDEAVGKEFKTSFIVTSNLLKDEEKRIVSEEAIYKIVAVIPQDKTPFFYVPFIDLRTLGITNYSQATLRVSNKNLLADARKKVESMGFLTSSVADTVQQVNALFDTVQKALALTGTIALAVAALGVFNTLTVSLLERTREIGLMKAMGMRSDEARDLFLIESMIIGFLGGFFGLIGGWLGGKLLSLLLTFIAFDRGLGYIGVSHIPWLLIINVMVLALIVGMVTGIYPARRAKKISALNALRYE
jgi:ABC-type antimicrobial peptide transport system permease subunit